MAISISREQRAAWLQAINELGFDLSTRDRLKRRIGQGNLGFKDEIDIRRALVESINPLTSPSDQLFRSAGLFATTRRHNVTEAYQLKKETIDGWFQKVAKAGDGKSPERILLRWNCPRVATRQISVLTPLPLGAPKLQNGEGEIEIARLEGDRYEIVAARGALADKVIGALRNSDLAERGVLLARSDGWLGLKALRLGEFKEMRIGDLAGWFEGVAKSEGEVPEKIRLRWATSSAILYGLRPLPYSAPEYRHSEGEVVIVRQADGKSYAIEGPAGSMATAAIRAMSQSPLALQGLLTTSPPQPKLNQPKTRLHQMARQHLEGFFALIEAYTGTKPDKILLKWKDSAHFPDIKEVRPDPVDGPELPKGWSEIEILDRMDGCYEVVSARGKQTPKVLQYLRNSPLAKSGTLLVPSSGWLGVRHMLPQEMGGLTLTRIEHWRGMVEAQCGRRVDRILVRWNVDSGGTTLLNLAVLPPNAPPRGGEQGEFELVARPMGTFEISRAEGRLGGHVLNFLRESPLAAAGTLFFKPGRDTGFFILEDHKNFWRGVGRNSIPFVVGEYFSNLLTGHAQPNTKELAKTYAGLAVGGGVGRTLVDSLIRSPEPSLVKGMARRTLPLFMALSLADTLREGRVRWDGIGINFGNILAAAQTTHRLGFFVHKAALTRRLAQGLRMVKIGSVAGAAESGGATLIGACVVSVVEFTLLKLMAEQEEKIADSFQESRLCHAYADAVFHNNELMSRQRQGTRVEIKEILAAEAELFLAGLRYETWLLQKRAKLEQAWNRKIEQLRNEEEEELLGRPDLRWSPGSIRKRYRDKRQALAVEMDRAANAVSTATIGAIPIENGSPKLSGWRRLFTPHTQNPVANQLETKIPKTLAAFVSSRETYLASRNHFWGAVLEADLDKGFVALK